VPEGEQLATPLNAQAQYAAYRLGSKDAHSPQALWVADEQHAVLSPIDAEHMDIRWPVHAVPGTHGFELLHGLPHPAAYDYFVWKGVEPDMHPYGACYHDLAEKLSTGVIEFLTVKKVNTVLVGGLALDYCVKTTALQLCKAGFRTIVNLEACRGLTSVSCGEAIELMQQSGIIIITSLAELEIYP
jgi:nicotinamidase/pyrazinamidase